MKAEFDNASVKVWFNNQGVSKNFQNVIQITREGNLALIKTAEGGQHLLNFDNVNMIVQENNNYHYY